MSEIIVGVVTPAVENEPLAIAGSKSIKLNTLVHTLGKSVDISKVPQVHDEEVSLDDINDYDLIVDEDESTISIKTSTKVVTVQGFDSLTSSKTSSINKIQNFVVPTSWTELPISLNLDSGLYNLLLRVVDADGKIGYYGSVVTFFSEQEQSVSQNSTTTVSLIRQGNDGSVIELRLVRTIGATPGTKLEIKGSTTLLAHPELTLSMRRVL